MSADASSLPTQPQPAVVSGWKRVVWRGEDWLVSLALFAMVCLPLTEIVLRKLFQTGLSGVSSIEQHLTLVVGMLGGAIAARQGRLLSLSTLTMLLKGRLKSGAAIFSGIVAVTVTGFLSVAAWKFVGVEREAPRILAYNIPTWIAELVLPIGFAVIALRLWWHSVETWLGRGVVLLFVSVLMWFCIKAPLSGSSLVAALLVGLVFALALGAPVFVALGGAALILFRGADVSIVVVAQEHYKQVINPSLPTIPLFTLAGYFLAEGGASRRLVRVFQALVGGFRGGPAIVTVLVCAFFTSFTGASGVTILALGGLLMPVLLAAGYQEKTAVGLLTGAGSLGLLFPPCLPVILYAIVAQITMKEMFLGGLGPGLLLVALTASWAVQKSPATAARSQKVVWSELAQAAWVAKWELLLPVVSLVALFSGWATPVEASAVTALYAFIVETLLYRDLKVFRDGPRVMTECGLLIGGVLLILGVAMGFTNYLVDAQVPAQAVQWATGTIHSKWLFLLAVNCMLLLVGWVMDIYSAIVVVVPILAPLGAAFGVDPVHLGIIFLANMELGYLSPLVGMNLFLSAYRFNKPVPYVARSAIPMMLVLLCGVLLITYVPALTTALPRWFK
jgi:tripartite ATP-independent transporter DctM subunit